MASGKDHDKYGLLAIAATSPYLLHTIEFNGIPVILGSILGLLWLSPDLDLSHSRPSERWLFLKFTTNIYRMIHRRHRGASHWPIIGSLVRFLFLIFVIYIIEFCIALLTNDLQNPYNFVVIPYIRNNFVLLFLGVEFSSLVHVFLDILSSLYNRWLNRKRRWF